jgi:TonB-dependent SusC/RagA subfamily outer membrane receptor
MIAAWIAYGSVTSLAIGLAALGLERACRLNGRQARSVWIVAMASSVVLPLAARVLPSVSPSRWLPSPGPKSGSAGTFDLAWLLGQQGSAGEPSATERLFGAVAALDGVLVALWAVLAALLLLRVGASFVRLHRERQSWISRDVEGTRVLLSERRGPAVLGFRRAAVVLPRWALELDREIQRLICMHEEEHLRAGDQRWLLAGLVTAIAVPWNLAVWWQLRRLRLAIEIDCDERVLRRGVSAASYGSLLLEVGARGRSDRIAWAALAEPRSFLERRVRSMIRKPSKHRSLKTVFAVAVAAILIGAACEAPMPVENEPQMSAAVDASAEAEVNEWTEGEEVAVGAMVLHKLSERMSGEGTIESIELTPVEEGYLLRADGIHVDGSEEPLKGKFEYRLQATELEEGEADHLKEANELTFRLKKAELNPAKQFEVQVEAGEPLVIIDGIVADKAAIGRIDNSRIDHVEVIKGKAAEELYGDRGANGVILVTTKDGDAS